MQLGTEVGLGPSHIVLDGAQAPPPQRGTAPNFWPMSVVAKRLDGSRCHGREVGLGPGHGVLHGTTLLLLKGAQPPIVGPCLCGQTVAHRRYC